MTLPDDIRPARGINKMFGASLLVLALIPAYPIYGVIKYDGLENIFDWPSLFNWFLGFVVFFCATGAYMLAAPQRVGVDVRFHPGGFTVSVRLYFRREQTHRLEWSEIKEVQLTEAPRNGDGIVIHPVEGAVASFPIKFAQTGSNETLARFHASAKAAGYRLERAGGFNALIVATKMWRVVPNV